MSDEIERLLNKHKTKRLKDNKKSYFKNLLSRILISIILVLISIIYIKKDNKNLLLYKEKVFANNIAFASINNWYQKYFGKIIPSSKEDIIPVSSETFTYKDITAYQNGFKLTVNSNEIIKSLESGIVVFIGEKDSFGNTVIVQGIDGVDIWYGNITSSNISLYDYLNKDTIIGESKSEDFYILLVKDGEYLDYEEYTQENHD